jgi:hypothetical protein
MSKKFEYKFEGSKLIASGELDPNGDGQPVVKVALEIELAEIPDEVFSAIKEKKEVKA